jgi:ubiquinone/menaquinone biosynthesis C-methylase UbiE
VDLAELLVAAAATGDPPLSVAQADAAALPVRTASIDFATAFMSLMDVADPERALREIARVLVPGGFVQFSIGHPTTTTPTRRWVTDDTGRRTALTTGGYFEEGSLTERWTFTAAPAELRARHDPFTVVIARRTLTEWFTAVTAAGLTIEAIDEPRADEDLARRHPEVADTRIAPYFLIVRARAAG